MDYRVRYDNRIIDLAVDAVDAQSNDMRVLNQIHRNEMEKLRLRQTRERLELIMIERKQDSHQ